MACESVDRFSPIALSRLAAGESELEGYDEELLDASPAASTSQQLSGFPKLLVRVR